MSRSMKGSALRSARTKSAADISENNNHKMKIGIGYCHYGIVHERFMRSLLDLIVHESARGNECQLLSAKGAYIAESRNCIVTEFLKTDANWLLFLDNDMIFAPDMLQQLLAEAVNSETYRPIVAGFYLTQYRFDDNSGVCSSWLEYNAAGKLSTIGELRANAVREVAACGMGGTLISRAVFEAVAQMFAKDDNWTWYGHDLIDGVRHGEDVTFCLRARVAGFKSYGTTSVQLGHIKTQCLDLSAIKKP